MSKIQVEVSFTDELKSIRVGGKEMEIPKAIKTKPVEEWFEPTVGRVRWGGLGAEIVRMKKSDAVQTEKEPVWQTSWLSDYIQDDAFEKYALKTSNGELVALAAYEILENDVMVHITYIESQPESNPTIVGHSKKYQGIGRVLIAYGIKLSIDHECGGTVTFEAKVPELAEHYVRDYGACPLPSFGGAPRYELSGEAAMNIFVTYLK